jgi:hypothetical protein
MVAAGGVAIVLSDRRRQHCYGLFYDAGGLHLKVRWPPVSNFLLVSLFETEDKFIYV